MHSVPAAIRRGGGYQVENAILFDGTDWFSRTPPAGGNPKQYTFSCWVKRVQFDDSGTQVPILAGDQSSAKFTHWMISGADQFLYQRWDDAVSGNAGTCRSAGLYRDPSDWVHLVVVYDSPQASLTDRLKLYVDGVLIDRTFDNSYPFQNWADVNINSAGIPMRLGTNNADGKNPFYMSEVVMINDQALDPTAFGEWNKNYPTVWQPKKVSGLDYSGVNSFYLNFADANDLGKDVSGNGNSFTRSGIDATNAVTDTPTKNCATFDPNIPGYSSKVAEDGNRICRSTGNNNSGMSATWPLVSGRWYAEMEVVNKSPSWGRNMRFGVQRNTDSLADSRYNMWGVFIDHNVSRMYIVDHNSETDTGKSHTYADGRRYQMALDCDTGEVWFGIDDDWITEPGVGAPQYNNLPADGTLRIATCLYSGGAPERIGLRTNPDELAYTPPADFLPMISTSIAEPAVANPKEYFDPVIYTGNGASRTIATQNKVDHVVFKGRDMTYWWNIYDSERGSPNALFWNDTAAEVALPSAFEGFGAESGFDLGPDAGANGTNVNGKGYVAYPFTKSPIAGMDIVLYTGNGANRQLAHNCGAKPELIFAKGRDAIGDNWSTYISPLGAGQFLNLNSNGAAGTDATVWWQEPTVTDFFLGTNTHVNFDTWRFVAYLFASVPGFSKVFSYTGNGNADGPFVHLGFKPAFVMVKRTNVARDWNVVDIVRDPYNVVNHRLEPNESAAEISGIQGEVDMDFNSNGYKLRWTAWDINQSGGSYVGIAFAENPFGMRGR